MAAIWHGCVYVNGFSTNVISLSKGTTADAILAVALQNDNWRGSDRALRFA